MKTPNEIKKGLACTESDVEKCSYCKYWPDNCVERVGQDAIAYIQQLENAVEFYSNTTQMLDVKITKLESRLAQVERERDAAVADLKNSVDRVACLYLDCEFCKDKDKPVCEDCEWEWRGVCEENSK